MNRNKERKLPNVSFTYYKYTYSICCFHAITDSSSSTCTVEMSENISPALSKTSIATLCTLLGPIGWYATVYKQAYKTTYTVNLSHTGLQICKIFKWISIHACDNLIWTVKVLGRLREHHPDIYCLVIQTFNFIGFDLRRQGVNIFVRWISFLISFVWVYWNNGIILA